MKSKVSCRQVLAMWASGPWAPPPPASTTCPVGLENAGAGMYTDPSVANRLLVFTLNPTEVSCGVGTVGVSGAFTGPLGRAPLTGMVAVGSNCEGA